MASNPDALIIGAGIVGAACARELAEEGLDVTIVDASTPGGATTACGMGHVVVMDDSEAQFGLSRYSQLLWEELREQMPAQVELDPCGTIWAAEDDEEMAAVHQKAKFYRGKDVKVEVLDAQGLREAEPNLRPDMVGGLRVPGDSVVYPLTATDWFLDCAKKKGATVHINRPVRSLDEFGATFEDGSRIEAGVVVNAAGFRGLDLLAEPVQGHTIKPRKGHLIITDRYPGFANHQIVELGYLKSAHSHSSSSVAFNIQPRATGQMLLGSSRQYGSSSTDVESKIVVEMIERASHFMPKIRELQAIRSWTGFRPATADKLPLIGSVPGKPRLLLALGHEGLGITTSTGTGRLIRDIVANRESKIERSYYRVDRNVK